MEQKTEIGSAALALSGADRAFLAWEGPQRPMHVSLLATFRQAPGFPPPSLDAIRAGLESAVRNEPRLLARLAPGGFGGRVELLRSVAFAIADHIDIPRFASLNDGAEYERQLGLLLARPLDLERPPWEIWLLPGRPGADRFTLACKFHHALLDGASGVALVERVLGGVARAPAPPQPRRATPANGRSVGAFGALRAGVRLLRSALRRGPATDLNGAVGVERHYNAIACDLAALDAGAAALGGTRNDALLAAVAGALRPSPGRVPETLRAFCPVSLRASGDRGPGNRISLWLIDLPVAEGDLEARVRLVREQTGRAKRAGDAAGGRVLEQLAARLGTWTARLGMAVAAWIRAYQVVVTNMSGPSHRLFLLGAMLESIVPFAPLFPGQRISFAAIAYGGRLHVGVLDGFDSGERGERFARDLARELAAVASHADRGPDALRRSA